MSIQQLNLVILKVGKMGLGLVLGLCVYFGFATLASAQTVELTVNGGSTAAIPNGQSVLLEWFISGAVSNCSINNGVGPIDTSSLPTTGSLTVIPPDNSSVNYTLSCSGGSSGVTVFVEPDITLTASPGTSVTYDPLLGTAYIDLSWSARYATQCTKVWWTTASNPGVQQWTTDANNPDRGLTSGNVIFTSGQQGPITETSTFYIECQNTVTGTVASESITITVGSGPQPPPPTVDLWSDDGYTVTLDPIINRGILGSLYYTYENADSCTRQAYYLDGTPYAELPVGFQDVVYVWGGVTHFFDIRIGTSTIFEVTCTQPAYVYEGVNYPSTTATDSVTVTVTPPASFDRSGVPPVSVSLTPVENPVFTNPSTGIAIAYVEVTTANAEVCQYSAVDTAGGWHVAADGWWGQNNSGNKSQIEFATLVGTTTLYAECFRNFDIENFAPGSVEYENGYEIASTTIFVAEGTEPPPEVNAMLFGNATVYDVYEIYNIDTAMSGFGRNDGVATGYGAMYPSLWGSAPNTNGSVTFPFNAYDNADGNYDIFVVFCDHNGGFNDYTLSTESGYVANWRSDYIDNDSWCNKRNTVVVKQVGVGVPLQDGELITITCNNTNSPMKSEDCVFVAIGFGQGDGGQISATPDTTTGFAPVSLAWAGEFSSLCNNTVATPQSGASYNYSASTNVFMNEMLLDVSTTTVFAATCSNTLSGDSNTGSLQVTLPPPSEVITATTTVAAGECYDPAIPGVRDTEPWEWANPSNSNFCEPAVDLNALAPSISFNDAIPDNVSGLYDSLEAIIAIENLGPGPLLAGNEIQFLGRLNLQSAVATLFSISNPLETVGVPGYTDGLGMPPAVTDILTRTFDGVPFGQHTLCARINIDAGDGLIFTEWNSNTANNNVCSTVTLPVPPPPMSISADRRIVRSGQTVDVTWTAHTSYPLNCTALGPGGINSNFDASSNHPSPVSMVQTTAPLTNTGRYSLTCTEPITNTTFTEEILVEVVPEQEEV